MLERPPDDAATCTSRAGGQVYLFRLTAQGRDGSGHAVVMVNVNSAPRGGVVRVAPTQGTAVRRWEGAKGSKRMMERAGYFSKPY